MIIVVLIGFLVASIAPIIEHYMRGAAGWFIGLLPLALTVYFGSCLTSVADKQILYEYYSWVPSLDVELAFKLDGLGLLFAMIITGIGSLVVIYGGGYLKGDPLLGRFYAYILIFMSAMLGVVLANNLITLFVFWEVTSISSYLLIGYKHNKGDSRDAALQALLVTGGGGLALLAGLVLLAHVSGTNTISEMASLADIIQSDSLYMPILVLVLFGAFTKSAQFPFHFWLPGAMAAPTPVSAYLHSATMVKAGVYLLARMTPILGGTDEWYAIVTAVGGITMLMGAFIAWQQTDLKRILAYSTISVLGMLVFLLGIGTDYAVKAALTLLLAHSLYKGALFLIAGILDHETGTRDISLMGGLWRKMPITAVSALIVAASMAGLPPLFGFIAKEVFYKATYDVTNLSILLTGLAMVSSVLMIVAAGMVSLKPFLGNYGNVPKSSVHEAPISMILGPALLAGLTIVFAFVPVKVATYFIKGAVHATLADSSVKVELVLWPGLNTVLMLSLLTIVAGGVAYYRRTWLQEQVESIDIGSRFGPARGYQLSLDGMLRLAKWQTGILQNGYLRYYLITIMAFALIVVDYTLLTQVNLDDIWRMPKDVRVYELFIAFVILAATALIIRTKSRLVAVAGLGTIGYSIALLYILFGAPDLAMTQFAIETLTVLLFVLVLYRLPRFGPISTTQVRIRDTIIAAGSGITVTLLVLIVTSDPAQSSLTSYFAENSYLLAKGRNIVNVILVDFRALDTMGEITVLAVAAGGVYSLLKFLPTNQANPMPDPKTTLEIEMGIEEILDSMDGDE